MERACIVTSCGVLCLLADLLLAMYWGSASVTRFQNGCHHLRKTADQIARHVVQYRWELSESLDTWIPRLPVDGLHQVFSESGSCSAGANSSQRQPDPERWMHRVSAPRVHPDKEPLPRLGPAARRAFGVQFLPHLPIPHLRIVARYINVRRGDDERKR